MAQHHPEISNIDVQRPPACGRSLAGRTMPKPGWHFWFIIVDLLSRFCFGGVASGQDCPGGQCPHEQVPRGWPTAAAVAETPLADYHRAIVRVGREDVLEPGASYSGTGTFVAHSAGRGLVLTASHVIEQGGGRIWVDFGRGRQAASLLGRDANLDLAALVVDNPPSDIRAIPVAGDDEWPHTGDNVEVVGFGGGRFRHFAAKVKGYTTKDFGACYRKTLDQASDCNQGALPGTDFGACYRQALDQASDNNQAAVPGTEPAGWVAVQATGHPWETDTRAAQQARSQLAIAFQPISGDSGGAILFVPAAAARPNWPPSAR
ncbi:MAG TPA: serine protease, partial [Pirellulales bacterium]